MNLVLLIHLWLLTIYNGALHTGTETGFTGYRFPIWIQCGLTSTPKGAQSMHIALLDWILCTVLEHSHAEHQAARIRIEAVWRQSGLWIWICIESMSKVPCGEPMCLYLKNYRILYVYPAIISNVHHVLI